MCGLFGVISCQGISGHDEASFARLGDQLVHRGPDGSGFIRDPDALLGMHRLSIMDPDNGWQPFWSEDNRYAVIGNGEIYNASTLRSTLSAYGHTFRTQSDMEVVPHLFEQYGDQAFSWLRGMFALAIFDSVAREIHLVRDKMGEKPLYYFEDGRALYFSSEQSALVRSDIVPLRLDHDVVQEYLIYGYTPEPKSIIRGVRKVPAASALTVSLADGTFSLQEYWSPLSAVGNKTLSNDDLVSSIREAITVTCTSDVSVGVALSGGLDSSLVAAIAASTRTDLHAFTVGYAEGGFDESGHAQALANQLNIPCHTTILQTIDVARDFASVCGARDEPISDIAGPALNAVPRSARESGVPVLLTGIGGDELFWGYDWIRKLAAWMTIYLEERSNHNNVTRPRFTSLPSTTQAKVDWLFNLGGWRTDKALRLFVSRGERDGTMPLPFYQFQPGYQRVRQALHDLTNGESALQQFEFRGQSEANLMGAYYTVLSNATYLRVNSFVQMDRLAMSHSVESRTPLADAELVSRILSGRLVDRDHLLPPKARLREIAAELLPAEVLTRPKRGFTPPVRAWVRAIWHENQVSLSAEALEEYSDLRVDLARKWLENPTTRGGRINQVALRLLTLELWLRSLK